MGTLILILALPELSLGLQEKTSADILYEFSKDLREAMTAAGLKDKDTRNRLTKTAQEKFIRTIGISVDGAKPKGTWDYFSDYLEDLAVADKHFRDPVDKSERVMWISACKLTFMRRNSQSREKAGDNPSKPRTTEEAYQDLCEAIGSVEKRFTPAAIDFRTAAYGVAKETFAGMIRMALAPVGDPENWYIKEIQDIDRLYPTRTEDDKKRYLARNGILKVAAKLAYDRARVAPK